MKIKTRLDGQKQLRAALRQLSVKTGRSFGKELRFSAARLAEAYAIQTQPYGRKKNQGKPKALAGRIENQIWRMYLTPGIMYDRILQRKGAKIAAAYWSLIKKKNYSEASKLHPFEQAQYAPFNANLHKRNRRGSGIKNNPEKQIVTDRPTRVKALVREKQKMVGFAKGGWAVSAQKLRSGKSRVPNWIKKQNSPATLVDLSRSRKPSIRFTNSVNYVSEILSRSQMQKSMDIEGRKIFKQLQNIVAKEARKAKIGGRKIGSLIRKIA